jgi:peroxisomal coenzyme A diphosphatase NUDT7
MDRIIGKGSKYLNTSVILLVADFNGAQEILFEKRNSEISQGDEICLPGGRIDESIDTTPEQAAIREACEELGLSPNKIVVKRYLGTSIATLGVAVDAFVGKINIDSWDEIHPNVAEVQSVFSIPIAWFQSHNPEEYHVKLEIYPFEADSNGHIEYLLPVCELGIPEKYHKSWSGGKLPIYVYKTDYGIIWGITAEIVREFIKDFQSE